jgi:hypothetical protein
MAEEDGGRGVATHGAIALCGQAAGEDGALGGDLGRRERYVDGARARLFDPFPRASGLPSLGARTAARNSA